VACVLCVLQERARLRKRLATEIEEEQQRKLVRAPRLTHSARTRHRIPSTLRTDDRCTVCTLQVRAARTLLRVLQARIAQRTPEQKKEAKERAALRRAAESVQFQMRRWLRKKFGVSLQSLEPGRTRPLCLAQWSCVRALAWPGGVCGGGDRAVQGASGGAPRCESGAR
jgi:hypothetical protein